ncbi:MAG: hypothetical protein IT210_25595 [Armatimonadetes bacterium]|nr:hypothetical protein [Armatimonadota bacterium]
MNALFQEAAGIESRIGDLRLQVSDSSGEAALGCAERLLGIMAALRAALEREAALAQKVEALRAQALERLLAGRGG